MGVRCNLPRRGQGSSGRRHLSRARSSLCKPYWTDGEFAQAQFPKNSAAFCCQFIKRTAGSRRRTGVPTARGLRAWRTSTGSLSPRAPPHHAKGDLILKELSRKSQSYKVESVSGGLSTDMHNFSLESKRETEYGPCRREMESILNSLKITNVLNPRGFRIPNCDKKGFYKKKQCRPSKGRKRGYCWCVDKYGQPLPGYDGKERGEAQCYNLESK
ncbi:hypothetical protein COCON_G00069510 [Conger conger]|uniref:Thyroglobulin type-1 domain-containing protein n=1 Tax=Conger conger TaxID=82655 RepID=A0A9Q1DT10_CONCO|nr:hypothetical protein COCON_G00069510 [Conger conger]